MLIQGAAAMRVAVVSEHTDRKAETVGVTLSKQLCAKPVGMTLWRYDEVKPHWDKLVLRSFVPDGGKRRALSKSGGSFISRNQRI